MFKNEKNKYCKVTVFLTSSVKSQAKIITELFCEIYKLILNFIKEIK